jgi:hypothetical protein
MRIFGPGMARTGGREPLCMALSSNDKWIVALCSQKVSGGRLYTHVLHVDLSQCCASMMPPTLRGSARIPPDLGIAGVGLAPTGKRHLVTAHTQSQLSFRTTRLSSELYFVEQPASTVSQ